MFDKTGSAELRRFRGEYGTNAGVNFICEDSDGPGAERVRTVCLDQFCEDKTIEKIDLLKIDIQEQEPVALRGAEHLINNRRIGTIFWNSTGLERAVLCPRLQSAFGCSNRQVISSQNRVYASLGGRPVNGWGL